jgi:hypothetical protein
MMELGAGSKMPNIHQTMDNVQNLYNITRVVLTIHSIWSCIWWLKTAFNFNMEYFWTSVLSWSSVEVFSSFHPQDSKSYRKPGLQAHVLNWNIPPSYRVLTCCGVSASWKRHASPTCPLRLVGEPHIVSCMPAGKLFTLGSRGAEERSGRVK